VIAYQLLDLPLSTADRERYYAEMRLFAALFGIPQSALPQGWEEFAGYVDDMFGSDSLAVSGSARRIAAALLAGAPRWYRALTARLLPARLRNEFGLTFGTAEHRSVERALSAIRRVHPWLPARLRYVAPYHEALARLDGRAQPDALTRLLNRVWIGQASMVVGGD
jgi:uncharacterized protein (DUF2236 family)